MKKVGLIIVVLIIIIAGIFIIKNTQGNKYNYEVTQVSEYNYYLYKEDNKYGVINKNGEIVIQANYTNIILPNPDKDIFVCTNDEETKILNSTNTELFTEYDNVEPIKLKNIASTLAYEKSVLMYEKDGLYGLIDFEGNAITKNIYNSIENLQPTEGKFLVTQDEKYGVIDLNGNTIIDTKYDKIKSDEYYTAEYGYTRSGFIVLNTTDDGYKYGYINYKGKTVLEAEYNDIERISKEDENNIYLIVSENGKYGIYKNSKNVLENEYQSISYIEDTDVLILQKNKKYGVSSVDGEMIITVENDTIDSKGIYLYAEKSNDKIVYDTNGNKVNINYNKSIYKTDSEEYMISTILNNNTTYYGIIDTNGNQLIEEKYKYIEYAYKNLFIAKDNDGNLGVIDSNDNKIIEMKYFSVQVVKGKNIIKAINSETGNTEFYSYNVENTLTVKNPLIQDEDEYTKISADEQTYYLDTEGNIIEDISTLKDVNYPDTLGEFTKQQMTIELIYYTKD